MRDIQEGKPNRKVFTITEVGREELRRWLHEYQEPPTHREAFLIQLFFASELKEDEIVGLLEQQRQAHEERLSELKKVKVFHDPRARPSIGGKHLCG